MKKQYEKPTIEVIEITINDIITASGTRSFDPDDILNKNAEEWFN